MTAAAGAGRRYLVALGVVAAWIVAGICFRLSADAYLLLGVPLLVAFQLGVARRPIDELWFKAPGRVPLPGWAWLAGAAAMATPLYYLIHGWSALGWITRGWMLCAVAGAIPLARSLPRISRATIRPLLLCFGTAGALGVTFMLGTALLHHQLAPRPPALSGWSHSPWFVAGRSFLLYVPVCFVLEEVFFRGGLDSYLDQPGKTHPWLSAAFVSVLWGLWHVPSVVARIPSLPPGVANPVVVFVILLGAVLMLPLIHGVIGIPLSLCWRRSGLLFVPALVHAFIDAVRNGLLAWH